MKLFKLTQSVNSIDDFNYDTYDSVIVAAETEDEARFIHPMNHIDDFKDWGGVDDDTWADAKDIEVEYIGEAKEGTVKGVILASYNAG